MGELFFCLATGSLRSPSTADPEEVDRFRDGQFVAQLKSDLIKLIASSSC